MTKIGILFYFNFQVAKIPPRKTPKNIQDGNECVLEVARKNISLVQQTVATKDGYTPNCSP